VPSRRRRWRRAGGLPTSPATTFSRSSSSFSRAPVRPRRSSFSVS
jgi:hypothetical protein